MNSVRVGVLYCTYRTVWAQGGRTEVSVEWGDVLRGCDEWDCVLRAGGWLGGEGGRGDWVEVVGRGVLEWKVWGFWKVGRGGTCGYLGEGGEVLL